MAKGGKLEDTVGRKCLCNALMANIGHAQTRKDKVAEPPLVTVGDDLNTVALFLKDGQESYSAAEVVEKLLGGMPSVAQSLPEPKEAAEHPVADLSTSLLRG